VRDGKDIERLWMEAKFVLIGLGLNNSILGARGIFMSIFFLPIILQSSLHLGFVYLGLS
jgi:hypothetical protein